MKGLAAKQEIEAMKGENASTVTDGAADVFATFYEELYQSRIAAPDRRLELRVLSCARR